MKILWRVIEASIITTIVVNGTVNVVDRINRSKINNEDYQEALKQKREAKAKKKAEKK